MTDTEETERLGSLFVSVTGSDSVVDRQEEASSEREVSAEEADETTDAASFHGLDDAIDEPETAEVGT